MASTSLLYVRACPRTGSCAVIRTWSLSVVEYPTCEITILVRYRYETFHSWLQQSHKDRNPQTDGGQTNSRTSMQFNESTFLLPVFRLTLLGTQMQEFVLIDSALHGGKRLWHFEPFPNSRQRIETCSWVLVRVSESQWDYLPIHAQSKEPQKSTENIRLMLNEQNASQRTTSYPPTFSRLLCSTVRV